MGPEPGKAGPGVQGGASEGQALFSVWKGGWGVPGRRHLASIGLGGQQSQPFTQLPCSGALRGPPLLFLWGLRSPPREHGLGSPALASRAWGGGVSSIWLSIICQTARGGQDKCF